MSDDVLNLVRKGLEGVVNDPRGTGKHARLPEEWGIKVAGKTGTAQVVGGESRRIGSKFGDHAWFAGYAPADKPEIVAVALVENGGHGGVAAAPLVKQVMEAFFNKGQIKKPTIAALDENISD